METVDNFALFIKNSPLLKNLSCRSKLVVNLIKMNTSIVSLYTLVIKMLIVNKRYSGLGAMQPVDQNSA